MVIEDVLTSALVAAVVGACLLAGIVAGVWLYGGGVSAPHRVAARVVVLVSGAMVVAVGTLRFVYLA